MRNPMVIGERVYLRALEKEDAEIFARSTANESERMMDRWRVPFSQIGFEQEIEDLHKHQPPEHIELAVCLKENDQCLGSVGIYDIDYVNGTAETGSWLGDAEYRGKGYGTEAKHLLLEYAFDRIQLHVLHSWVWEPNTRSAAALMKQGYQPAGRLEREEIKNGVHRAGLMFDVKRDEWLAAREAWKAKQAAVVS